MSLASFDPSGVESLPQAINPHMGNVIKIVLIFIFGVYDRLDILVLQKNLWVKKVFFWDKRQNLFRGILRMMPTAFGVSFLKPLELARKLVIMLAMRLLF
jgi:hypothetical protein